MSNQPKIHEAVVRLTYRDGTRRLIEYQVACGGFDELINELQTREQVTKIEVFGNIKNAVRHEEWRSSLPK